MRRVVALIVTLLFVCPVVSLAQNPFDVNGDDRVGLEEAIYALQVTAGMKVIPETEKIDIQLATVEAIKVAVTNGLEAESLARIVRVLESLGLATAQNPAAALGALPLESPSADDIFNSLNRGFEWTCGTIYVESVENRTLRFEFDPASPCGIDGTVYLSVLNLETGIAYQIQYVNVMVGDCTINGTAVASLVFDGGLVTYTHSSTDLSVCGTAFDGTVVLTVDTATGEIESVTVQNTVTTTRDGKTITVVSDVTYSPAQGGSGESTVTVDDREIAFTFEDVVIDPACGIPTGGTMTVNGTPVDFTGTTCDNPVVTVYVRGIPVEMSLADAIDLLIFQDTANILVDELAGAQEGIEQLTHVVGKLGLNDAESGGSSATAVRTASATAADVFTVLSSGVTFACGTVSVKSALDRTVQFDFDPASDCGIAGTVLVTVNRVDGGIVYTIEYQNVVSGDCTINGTTTSSLAVDEGMIIYTHTSDDLWVCGTAFNGTLSVTIDSATGEPVLVGVDNQVTTTRDGKPAAVDADLTWTPDGGINGTLLLTVDGKIYDCVLTGIFIDPACGIPTAGTMVINGITLDFSETTCENPVVTATVNGRSAEIGLDDALDLLKAEDPASIMIQYLAGSNAAIDGFEDMDEVLDAIGVGQVRQASGTRVTMTATPADAVFDFLNKGLEWTCGTVYVESVENRTLRFEFDPTTDCGIGGTVILSVLNVEGGVAYQTEYIDVTVNACLINGSAVTAIEFTADQIKTTHVSSDLSVCGNTFNGTVTIILDAATGDLVSVAVVNSVAFYANGSSIQVDSDLTMTPDAGINGTATLVVDGKTYNCTFQNITFDSTCGIPNGGIMIINGITLDFFGTTCDNPVVIVTVRNVSVEMALDDAIELLQMEDPVNEIITLANRAGSTADDLGNLGDVLNTLGLAEASGARSAAGSTPQADDDLTAIFAALSTQDFACGTYQVSALDRSVTFTFDPTSDCGIGGTAIVQVKREENGIVFAIQYTDVTVSDCVINGTGTCFILFGEGEVSFTHISDNLTVCGNSFDGATTITVDSTTGQIKSVRVDSEITYTVDGETVAVDADLTYTPEGGVNGTATIEKGRKTYNCTFIDVVIDPDCGIPTGGVITVNGIPVDFSGTTCENPVVTVTVRGRSVELSLAEAMAFFTGA